MYDRENRKVQSFKITDPLTFVILETEFLSRLIVMYKCKTSLASAFRYSLFQHTTILNVKMKQTYESGLPINGNDLSTFKHSTRRGAMTI